MAVIARQKPVVHEITPAQSRRLEVEHATLRQAPSLADQLAAAEKELAAWREKFDNYSGNNPNKYGSDIRRCADNARRLMATIVRQKPKDEPTRGKPTRVE
ncbi:MAG TPA: hypothetical protein VFE41_03910 [Acetobacteraceae bacterium]|nr:hypothetical protein [Acetobacteraceae bacterium]